MAQEDHEVSDRCTWPSLLASDRVGGKIRTTSEPVEDVQEKSEQVHVALRALTESEGFDIVLGAPSGLEVLRRLVRR